MRRPTAQPEVSADTLLRAYALGIFPMSDGRDDPAIHWVDPRLRGILPMDGPHVSRSLARRIARGGFDVAVNTDFAGVVAACADRPDTWISATIARLYQDLHESGHAHCLEIRADETLIGGVYGVALGTAFFGESMFSRATDGSKLALVFLLQRLRAGGFTLFDTQFLTPHLASMGGLELPRADYHARLAKALQGHANFFPDGYTPDYSLGASPAEGSGSASGKADSGTMQRKGQTS